MPRIEIAHFMADRYSPTAPGSQTQWLDGEHATRTRWHSLVTARREHLRGTP
ncbi:hypothetical protein [Streptomyces decoyicus]|uniref:hypothetical protein n=1 Tax=Streptomyces decoyicus TaxID=249567 RepID=UPI00380D872C